MNVAALSVFLIVLMILIYVPLFAMVVLQYIAMWKILRKMDRPGWWIFVPGAALFIFYDRCWKRGAFWRYVAYAAVYMVGYFIWMFYTMFQSFSFIEGSSSAGALALSMILLLLFVLVCLVLMLVNLVRMYIRLAKAFGKSTGFGWGLAFIAPVFLMILGFGNAQYIGNTTKPAPPQYAPPQDYYIPPQN